MTATLPPTSGSLSTRAGTEVDTDSPLTAPVAIPSVSVRDEAGTGRHASGKEPLPPGRTHVMIGRLAAIALPAGPALMMLSTVFDPHSTEPEPRGMFVAYGADRAGADIAATVLHYGFATFGVGLLLAALAMAGRRGRGLALAGGLLGLLGFVNMSGAVLSDWYDAYLASAFGPDKAMAISQAAGDMPALGMGWMLPAVAGCALGPILLAVGLARGRIVGWWVVALPVAMGAMFAVSKDLGAAGFLIGLGITVVFAVLVALGLRRTAVTGTDRS